MKALALESPSCERGKSSLGVWGLGFRVYIMFVVLVAEFESVSVLRLCKNPGETEVVLGRRVHRTSDVKP